MIPENGLNITPGMDYLYPQVSGGIVLPQGIESSEKLNESLIVDRTFNGKIKTRSLFPSNPFNKIFNVVHPVVNTNQKDWIIQFYKINRLIQFDFTWKADDRIYTVVFLNQPKVNMIGGQWWKVEVSFAQII